MFWENSSLKHVFLWLFILMSDWYMLKINSCSIYMYISDGQHDVVSTLPHKNAHNFGSNCPINIILFFAMLRRVIISSTKFLRGTNFRTIFSVRNTRKLVPRRNWYIYSNRMKKSKGHFSLILHYLRSSKIEFDLIICPSLVPYILWVTLFMPFLNYYDIWHHKRL